MSMSAAVPVLNDQYTGSFNVTPENVNYSNPSAYDAQGNLIVTGKFKDEFTFNNIEIFGEGVNNAFIVKYDAANTPKWATALAGSATITSIDTDADGNIYVAGIFAGNVDFLSATVDGEPSISKGGLKIDDQYTNNQSASFIAKYDKDGKILAVNSFVPEVLPFLAEKGKEINIFGDGYLYTPSGTDLYFNVGQLKVDGSKVYVSACYTGQTTVGNDTFDGAYANLYDMMYFDVQNIGVLSVDCATLNTAEIVAKMNLVGPFNDGTPALENLVIDVANGQVVAGFTMSTSEYENDVDIVFGSYTTKITPTKGVVEYVVLKEGSLSSIKKAATELFISYDGLNDVIINNNDVYIVGSYDTDMPATSLAETPVAPAGKSDVFVANFNLSDLDVKRIYNNGIDEGEEVEYEMVCSTALVDGSLYISTRNANGLGTSYWFDGTTFSEAPVAATGVAVGDGVVALVASDATKVDYKTYTFEQTGIADIEAEFDENAPVEYFNLQGIRVANPENGLYIRRQGNKVEKVIVK